MLFPMAYDFEIREIFEHVYEVHIMNLLTRAQYDRSY